MFVIVVAFLDLFIVSLLVGTVFGIWLGYNPSGFSYAAYLEYQQNAIRSLNVKMPIMGAAGIALTVVFMVLTRERPTIFYLLFAAAACLAAGLVVTRFFNQRINARVITWTLQDPPPDWMDARSSWWQWHIVRMLIGLGALALLILSVLLYSMPLD